MDTLPTVRQLSAESRQHIQATVLNRIQAEQVRQPRRPRWKRVAIAGGTAAAAITAGVIVLTGAPAAAWSEVPDRLDDEDLATALADCQAAADRMPLQAAGLAKPDGPGRTVIGERRGTTFSVFVTDQRHAMICVGTPDSRFTGIAPVVPAASGAVLTVDEAQSGQRNGAGATRFVYGRMSGMVAKVVIRTSDGRTVTASRQDQNYLAWWPSGADAVSVTAYDAAGQVIAADHPAQGGSGSQPPTQSPSRPTG